MGDGPSQSTTESSPQWMQDAGKDIYDKAKTFYNKPYEQYSGPRVAPFATDSTNAFTQLRDYMGNAPNVTGEALDMARAGANQPAGHVSTERVVDENGQLGAISDYMNPYLGNALAPTIRNLEESATKERMRVGDLAQGAGGYNDARHGVLEGEVGRNLNTAIGDTSAKAYSDAFASAMGMRSGDLDRFFNRDVTNANLGEAAAGRKLSGAGTMVGTAAQGQSDFLSRISSLLSSGTAQQQQQQNQYDVDYSDFEKQKQDEYDRLASLVSVIQGLPYNKTSTTTSNDGGGGLLGGLGALFGAFL